MRGLLILFVFLAAFTGWAQQGSAPAPESQYYSGYIAETNAGSLTVVKKPNPKPSTERRVFVMDAQTKVEGKLRANARVTVRFETGPNGDRAVRIIVRG